MPPRAKKPVEPVTENTTPAKPRAPRAPRKPSVPVPAKRVPPTVGSRPLGRIPVADVFPLVDDGTRPSKSVVGEEFDITATVYREGHDAVNANVVLTAPDGVTTTLPMTCINPGLDHWTVTVSAPTRWA